MDTNFKPDEYVIFVQSSKIGNHDINAIHSITMFRMCTYP